MSIFLCSSCASTFCWPCLIMRDGFYGLKTFRFFWTNPGNLCIVLFEFFWHQKRAGFLNIVQGPKKPRRCFLPFWPQVFLLWLLFLQCIWWNCHKIFFWCNSEFDFLFIPLFLFCGQINNQRLVGFDHLHSQFFPFLFSYHNCLISWGFNASESRSKFASFIWMIFQLTFFFQLKSGWLTENTTPLLSPST